MNLPKKLKPGDPVVVRWIDANSPTSNTWMAVSDFKDSRPTMEILSLGFFVEERRKYIRLAANRSDTDEYVEVANRVFNIPIGCVKSVRRLK